MGKNGLGLGSVWGQFGVGVVSVCVQFGVRWGSVWEQFEIDLRVVGHAMWVVVTVSRSGSITCYYIGVGCYLCSAIPLPEMHHN